MSYTEALQWFEYRRRHGGIGPEKVARILAQIAMLLNHALGGKATFDELFYATGRKQRTEPDDDEEAATIEDVMNELLKACK